MQVKIYATLRDLMGVSRLDVETAGTATVGDVLDSLVKAHPALATKLFDAGHNLTGFVTVLLNGRSIAYLQGLSTPVQDTDVLALFPPVGGGSSR
jgi:sulfur-carrier protein